MSATCRQQTAALSTRNAGHLAALVEILWWSYIAPTCIAPRNRWSRRDPQACARSRLPAPDTWWCAVTSRGGLIFFTISFLTFMAISGFPSFVDEMQVFVRERLNGYYGVLPYTIANTIASLPFLALISIACTVVAYYLAGLNSDGDRVAYFMLDLFVCLVTVRPLGCFWTGGIKPPTAGNKPCLSAAQERVLYGEPERPRPCTAMPSHGLHQEHLLLMFTSSSPDATCAHLPPPQSPAVYFVAHMLCWPPSTASASISGFCKPACTNYPKGASK